MPPRGTILRWSALTALGLVAVACGWLVLTQLLLLLLRPQGELRWPHITQAEVLRVDRDQEGKLTGQVQVMEDGRPREFNMDKAECLELDQERPYKAWFLENYVQDGYRPDQFRLSLWRLIREYPEPLLALVVWGMALLRRGQKKADAAREAAAPPRKVWKDEFHSRAERFKKPEEPPQG
jgi:hypothetical protein